MAYKDTNDGSGYAPEDYFGLNRPVGPQQFTATNPEQPVQYTNPGTQGATGNTIPPAPGPANGTPATGPAGAGAPKGGDPKAFIAQWQAEHPASEGIGPLADALAAAGFQTPRFMYGQTASNNELVVNGEKFKVLGGEDNPSTASWYKPGTNDSAPGGGRTGGFGSAAYRVGAGVPGQGTVFGADNPLTGKSNALLDYLMGRGTGQISDSTLPALQVDPNDPIIKRQVNAYSATQTRAERNYEAALAERAGTNANIGAERRIGAENVGMATSGFEAQLMNQELGARRQEIQQALSGAYGALTAEQSMQLQEELAQLGLSQNAYQFDVSDEFRRSPLAS